LAFRKSLDACSSAVATSSLQVRVHSRSSAYEPGDVGRLENAFRFVDFHREAHFEIEPEISLAFFR